MRAIDLLDTQERHQILEFIYKWLSGVYMSQMVDPQVVAMWEKIKRLFPPKTKSLHRLYRLVTLPMEATEKTELRLKPAPNAISSWSSTLSGIDSVAGVARDVLADSRPADTARLAIQAGISGQDIIATPASLRRAFLTLSEGYYERYPEIEKKTKRGGMTSTSYEPHPDWPGDYALMDLDEVDFLRDVMNRRGGYYKQYEHVVHAPDMIDAKVVRIYRKGHKTLRYGNDDPHN